MILAARSTVKGIGLGAATGQLQTVATTTPAHVLEALMNQEHSSAAEGIVLFRQCSAADMVRHP